jgi:hypothetical protein
MVHQGVGHTLGVEHIGIALSEPSTEDGGWARFRRVPELTEQDREGLVS